jgi:hypothetical protein
MRGAILTGPIRLVTRSASCVVLTSNCGPNDTNINTGQFAVVTVRATPVVTFCKMLRSELRNDRAREPVRTSLNSGCTLTVRLALTVRLIASLQHASVFYKTGKMKDLT